MRCSRRTNEGTRASATSCGGGGEASPASWIRSESGGTCRRRNSGESNGSSTASTARSRKSWPGGNERDENPRHDVPRRFSAAPARAGAIRAAELLSGLSARGRTPGVLDILVAGIALASGYDTIVTNDEGFRRIQGIKVQTH